MKEDLKILLYLLAFTVSVVLVYFAVGFVFDVLDNPKLYKVQVSYKSTFVRTPADDPETRKDWKPDDGSKRESRLPGPLSYVHPTTILIITGIISIGLFGLVIFIILDKYR